MTKRNPSTNRHDLWSTPPKAIDPVLPYLEGRRFAEPCCGDGWLAEYLTANSFECHYCGDISKGQDALLWKPQPLVEFIITNPPWTRSLMHPLITHLVSFGLPVWLLIDADWMHTKQASKFLYDFCTQIISIGRVRWMPGTAMDGFDNACWYEFRREGSNPFNIEFIPREVA